MELERLRPTERKKHTIIHKIRRNLPNLTLRSGFVLVVHETLHEDVIEWRVFVSGSGTFCPEVKTKSLIAD